MTIKTAFELKQKVHIHELNLTGRVRAFFVDDGDGTVQYSVRYFADGKSQSAYFFEDDITDKLPEKGTAL